MGSLEEAGEGDVDNDALTVGIPATYLFTTYLCYKNILYSQISLNSSDRQTYNKYYLHFTE